MDNKQIAITSEGLADLEFAMHIAFSKSLGRSQAASHWAVVNNSLVFFWTRPVSSGGQLYRVGSESVDPAPFPTPIDAHEAANVAMRWLNTAPMPPEPDHDGDNKRGWHLFNSVREFPNEQYQKDVYGMWQAIVAVAGVWATYGK